ncbi:hypothetical protein BX616_010475 [Lobosporangium transversale]|uniref:Velvet factor n=1 Tax=Lobosporangium transversale TaxID=64571 RepID=A0A1Y2GBC2_9FUNG|nr:velvet factor [Lobosporangium transversale]KAF9911851.1 hypothetical protein BX616_010475 [Lobosporangium transversale]ORZ04815.1 velvet factor [Lobosporangium transversale]|eukprot:XP_021876752.1 velvet factor [Lobosporangium transversale]
MGKSDKYYYQSRPLEDNDDLDVDPNDLIYSLEIVQQPIRARMCGFGDKDRRNVTPAPVLKLVAKTPDGKIVSGSHLSKQTFVVTADLWLEDEVTDRNLVLISSIPSSRTAAYSQQYAQQVVDHLDIHQNVPSSEVRDTASGPSASSSAGVATAAASSSNTSRMSIRNVIHDDDPSMPSISFPSSRATLGQGASTVSKRPADPSDDEDNGTEDAGDSIEDEEDEYRDNDMYVEQDLKQLEELENMERESSGLGSSLVMRRELSTRNLVGQTAVSGQVAPGLDDDMSHIWFAFSILSIRTEGFFKIRFCLTDLMRIPVGGKSKTICQVFSNTIHVQTPKKFEGTCDNNQIAIHLNKNCIRIPARKDEKKLNKNRKGSLT